MKKYAIDVVMIKEGRNVVMKGVRSKLPGFRVLFAVGFPVIAVLIASMPRAQADAPCAGRYTVMTGVGEGTVLDNETHLLWQQGLDAASYDWAAANTYCDSLMFAGVSDWRLPTISELETLVDEGRAFPAIDGTAFPNTPKNKFWSSTPHASNANTAWNVDFNDGQVYVDGDTANYRARCVVHLK